MNENTPQAIQKCVCCKGIATVVNCDKTHYRITCSKCGRKTDRYTQLKNAIAEWEWLNACTPVKL